MLFFPICQKTQICSARALHPGADGHGTSKGREAPRRVPAERPSRRASGEEKLVYVDVKILQSNMLTSTYTKRERRRKRWEERGRRTSTHARAHRPPKQALAQRPRESKKTERKRKIKIEAWRGPEGLTKLGFSKFGLSRLGFSKPGLNRLGFSKLGFNKLGLSR